MDVDLSKSEGKPLSSRPANNVELTQLVDESSFPDRPDTLEDGSKLEMNENGPKILPFEFRALEACLEAACNCLESETGTLEQEAYPALDELTSKVSTLNLERVRQIKSRLVAISGRVQKVMDNSSTENTNSACYRVCNSIFINRGEVMYHAIIWDWFFKRCVARMPNETWIQWEFCGASHPYHTTERSLENVNHEPRIIVGVVSNLVAVMANMFSWLHILFAVTKWISIIRGALLIVTLTSSLSILLTTRDEYPAMRPKGLQSNIIIDEFSAVIRRILTTILLILGNKIHGYNCVWESLNELLNIHHLRGEYEMVANIERELAFIPMRHEKAMMKVTLVFINKFVPCAGTVIKREEQLSLFLAQSHGGAYGIAVEDREFTVLKKRSRVQQSRGFLQREETMFSNEDLMIECE
ncbi:hypothetical protein KI387_001711, partial [Taxus chinensis]